MTLNRVPSSSPDSNSDIVAAFDPISGATSYSAAGAIGVKEGLVVLPGATALAMTLAAPTAGLPSAGGDDGKQLRILGVQAKAHTVTTPANKINGNKLTATFAAIADTILLTAYNGVWYASDNTTTLS